MQERLAGLPATTVRAKGPERAPPALLLHGMGLGRWIYSRMQAQLAEEGISSVAVDLPGHGEDALNNPPLDRAIDAATEAARELAGCAVVGHSFGGYVGQVVTSRLGPPALVLIASVPPPGVAYLPTRSGLAVVGRLLRSYARRRPLASLDKREPTVRRGGR